jgi:hypothetical protein
MSRIHKILIAAAIGTFVLTAGYLGIGHSLASQRASSCGCCTCTECSCDVCTCCTCGESCTCVE